MMNNDDADPDIQEDNAPQLFIDDVVATPPSSDKPIALDAGGAQDESEPSTNASNEPAPAHQGAFANTREPTYKGEITVPAAPKGIHPRSAEQNADPNCQEDPKLHNDAGPNENGSKSAGGINGPGTKSTELKPTEYKTDSDSPDGEHVGHEREDGKKDAQRHDAMDVDATPPLKTGGMEKGWLVLTNASLDPRWRRLLEAFIAFESQGPPSGKLNTSGRPSEVKTWIGSKKKDAIPEINVQDFSTRWKGWWQALQPEWRKDDHGTKMSRDVPEDCDWAGLRKGGTSGLYTVLVSLAWWAGQVSGVDDPMWPVVEDITWVLIELSKLPMVSPRAKGKRTATQMDEGTLLCGPRKRSKTAKALNFGGITGM